MSCGVGHRRGSDPTLLWLSCRLAAKAPSGPLAWEPPYIAGEHPPQKKRKKEKKTSVPLDTFSHNKHTDVTIIQMKKQNTTFPSYTTTLISNIRVLLVVEFYVYGMI